MNHLEYGYVKDDSGDFVFIGQDHTAPLAPYKIRAKHFISVLFQQVDATKLTLST